MARIRTDPYSARSRPPRMILLSCPYFGGKRRPEPSTVKKLQRREIGERSRVSLGIASLAPERFKNLQLQEEFDIYDDSLNWSTLPFLKVRSQIVEIIAAKDVMFVLTKSGLGAAFSLTTNKRICFLNTSPDEMVSTIFYNKYNESLITMSRYEGDDFSSVRCKTTPIEYIRRNQLNAGFPIFEAETLTCPPGYVELDDVNGKVLIYNGGHDTYKVYDLKDYSLLCSLSNSDKKIQVIKMSPGILLIILRRNPKAVTLRLKILSIEDGSEVKSFRHSLHRGKTVDFVEQSNEKLLVKQMGENLQIIDVRNSKVVDVKDTKYMKRPSFFLLDEKQHFLAFWGRNAEVRNFKGEIIAKLDDHVLFYQNFDSNNFCISSDQELIISYCIDKGGNNDGEGLTGSVNISNIRSGRCIGKLSANDPQLLISPRCGDTNRSLIRSTIKDALREVTALFYDENRDVLFTGNKNGMVHVWHS